MHPLDVLTAARTDLKALDRDGLIAFVRTLGEPDYRGRQIFKWLYGKGAASFEEMTDLPAALRERLGEVARIGGIKEVTRQVARDRTMKFLFRLESGREIESVLIPDIDLDGQARRLTVCVSSQVGCAMGCHFCATGLMGFHQNLTSGEIHDQVFHLSRAGEEVFGRPATNVVFMGMGEPMQNYDAVTRSTRLMNDSDALGLGARRITISTVGLARRIRKLADDQAEGRVPKVGLAVSLHAPTDAQRSAIMPVNRSEKTDLGALKEAVQHFHARTGNRVTYEYCLFEDRNDGPEDARNLAAVTRWAPSKVNIIVYNPVPGADFRSPSEARLQTFLRALVDEGVTVTVRRSRGQDIDAACGQLARESAVEAA